MSESQDKTKAVMSKSRQPDLVLLFTPDPLLFTSDPLFGMHLLCNYFVLFQPTVKQPAIGTIKLTFSLQGKQDIASST